MRFHLRELTGDRLEAAARHYEERGFIVVEGLKDAVTSLFRPVLAEKLGLSAAELPTFLDANSAPVVLPIETRERLSRIDTTGELADGMYAALSPILRRLLGPVVHISSNYHAQVKGGDVLAVDRGGGLQEYREVQGQYLIHQDFTGARIPTSPSQLTVWVAQNSSPDWNLRLYPGSHRHGLLNNQWVSLEDPWLEQFGTPIDVPAEEGIAIVFNSLLLHASSNPGPRRRVSCDIRFFPLCGFLPSLPRVLGERPAEWLRTAESMSHGPTLTAPIRETLAFLGEDVLDESVPPHSILNWANYLHRYLRGEANAAAEMVRFVNTDRGLDTPEIYTSKFHNQPIHREPIERAREQLAAATPGGSGFANVDGILSRWQERRPQMA